MLETASMAHTSASKILVATSTLFLLGFASSLSTASAQTTEARGRGPFLQARVYGLGSDYFEDGLHDFRCELVPTEPGRARFYAACSPAQARDLADGVFTLELGPRMAADLTPAAADLERRLGIVRPALQIVASVTIPPPDRRRARRHVPDGPRSNLIIRVNYADMNVTYATEAKARLMMHDPDSNGQDVDGLFRASTYGRMSFPAALTDVITVNSPLNGTDQSGCDIMGMTSAANLLVAEQHPGIDPSNFIHRSYFLPDQIPDCLWAGVATMDSCHNGNASTRCMTWMRTGLAPILAHELGHNLGVRHAADDRDDDGIQEREYGDAGAIMGEPVRWISMNAAHRELLGYLGDGPGNGVVTHAVSCAAEAHAEVTLNISRLDLAPGGSNPNPNMVRIARHQDPSSTLPQPPNYLLSFKALADWDGSTTIPGDYTNRLQIHTYGGTKADNTMIVQTLGEGDTFNGHANRDGIQVPLTIRVAAINTDAITVTVNTGCPTPAPTSFPTPEYCPEGYSSYGNRYARGLGRITIVTTHEECAARCTLYSAPEYHGGCKGYMTGMYNGMLFCRSYGGDAFYTACAPWATPDNPGQYSGELGFVHPRTNQRNIGGNCCMSKLWLLGSGPTAPPSGTTGGDLSASSAASGKTAGADIAVVLLVTVGALVVFYCIYQLGRWAGRPPSQFGEDTPNSPMTSPVMGVEFDDDRTTDTTQTFV